MYKIIKDDNVLAYVEKIRYIKKHTNGSYVQCEPGEAQGIAYDSIPYNLPGHDEITGADTVITVQITDKEFSDAMKSNSQQVTDLQLAVIDMYETIAVTSNN